MDVAASRKRGRRESEGGGHRVRKCEECRRLKQACKPLQSHALTDEEKCKLCTERGKACGPKVFPVDKDERESSPQTSPPRKCRNAPLTPDHLSVTPNLHSVDSSSIPNLPTPQSFRRTKDVPYRTPGPIRGIRPLSKAGSCTELSDTAAGRDYAAGSTGPKSRDAADDQIDDLTEFFILLESTKEAKESVDAAGQLERENDDTRNDVFYLEQSFNRKVNAVLGKIETLISDILEHVETAETSRAELLCYKTLDRIDMYGNCTDKSWKSKKQATLLRKLLAIYQHRGQLLQIHPILRRLQQLPDTVLEPEEQALFARSYTETSQQLRPLLDRYSIKVDEEQNLHCENLFPALNRAILDQDDGTIQILLEQNPYRAPHSVPYRDILDRQPLHVAAASGHAGLVRSSVSAYPREVNSRDLFKRTPLHYAACKGGLEVFKILLAANANVEDRDKYAVSILTYAAGGQFEIVRHMLEDLKIDPNDRSFGNIIGPLHRAAENNQKEIAHLLLQHGACDYQLSSSGETAYQIAADKNFHACATLLAASTDTAVGIHDLLNQGPPTPRGLNLESSISDPMSSNATIANHFSQQFNLGWSASSGRQPASSQIGPSPYRSYQSGLPETTSFSDVSTYSHHSPTPSNSQEFSYWYSPHQPPPPPQ